MIANTIKDIDYFVQSKCFLQFATTQVKLFLYIHTEHTLLKDYWQYIFLSLTDVACKRMNLLWMVATFSKLNSQSIEKKYDFLSVINTFLIKDLKT